MADTEATSLVRQLREALHQIDVALDPDDWAGEQRMLDITRPAIAAADEWLAQQRARDEAAAAERQRLEADARAAEQARQDEQDREDARRRALDLERQAATVPAPIKMQIVPPSAPSQPEPATLKLGAICERLGFTVTAAFLADTLHIKHIATDKAAKLYRESDWPVICRQLTAHINAVREVHASEAFAV